MQLRKTPPYHINPDAPFDDDRLEQRSSIELLTRLIQSTEQPFVITVEAPWGWGKTKFIERWKAHLQKENHTCLYFNAWENDFVSDPLVAFIGELRPLVESLKGAKNPNSSVHKNLTRLKRLGAALAKKGAPILIKGVTTKILGSDAARDVSDVIADSAEDVADALSKAAEKEIETYADEKQGIVHFHEVLTTLAEPLTAGEGKPKQVVFFVDELDRCRPDFAMTLLERIKHLFNVERIVFILALDREQLRNTVRILYGVSDQADAYLRRFIDLSYQLPKPQLHAFVQLLQDKFQLIPFFQSRQNGQLEHERFAPAFIETANWLELDLRTQEQCFTRFNAIARLWRTDIFLPTDALSILVGLKVGKPEYFDNLRLEQTPPGNFASGYKGADKDFGHLLHATLEAVFLSHEIFAEKCRSLGKLKQTPGQYDERTAHFEHLARYRKELLRVIDFSTRFE